jgi:hypothetical protein
MWLGSTRDTAAALGDMPASLWSGQWCFAGQKISPPELRERGLIKSIQGRRTFVIQPGD